MNIVFLFGIFSYRESKSKLQCAKKLKTIFHVNESHFAKNHVKSSLHISLLWRRLTFIWNGVKGSPGWRRSSRRVGGSPSYRPPWGHRALEGLQDERFGYLGFLYISLLGGKLDSQNGFKSCSVWCLI